MPVPGEATPHFKHIRTLDQMEGSSLLTKVGVQRGQVCEGHLQDPAADGQGALCEEHRVLERRLHPAVTNAIIAMCLG